MVDIVGNPYLQGGESEVARLAAAVHEVFHCSADFGDVEMSGYVVPAGEQDGEVEVGILIERGFEG